MADPSLQRQVFPPGLVGDALFEAGKLPGEAGNLWGKANAAKDKVMMPMNALMQRAFPGQFQPPMQAQVPPQQLPQNMMRPPQVQQMPPNMGPPNVGPGQQRMPGSDLMPARPPMPGTLPPNAMPMHPPGMAQPGVQMGPQQNFAPPQMQPMPPQPVNNIFAQRMARY